MFIYKKRFHKKQNSVKSFYWIITTFCMGSGMIAGFFLPNHANDILYTTNPQDSVLFSYSLLKNIFVVILLFLNAFSLVGFPLSAMLLFLAGFMISDASIYIYLFSDISHLSFIIRAMPHIIMQISMYFFLANKVFHYSADLFATIQLNRGKRIIRTDFFKLFLTFLFSVLLAFLSSAYETFIL